MVSIYQITWCHIPEDSRLHFCIPLSKQIFSTPHILPTMLINIGIKIKILLCKEVLWQQNMKFTLQINTLKYSKAGSHINTKETPIFQGLSLFPPLRSDVMNDTTGRCICRSNGAEFSLAKIQPKGEQ
jgi:hypothetical protein